MEEYKVYLSFGIMVLSLLLVLKHKGENYAKIERKTPQAAKPQKRN